MNALFITHTPQLPSPHHKLHIRNPQLRNTTYLKYMRIVVSVRVCRNFGGPSPLGRNPSAWACAPSPGLSSRPRHRGRPRSCPGASPPPWMGASAPPGPPFPAYYTLRTAGGHQTKQLRIIRDRFRLIFFFDVKFGMILYCLNHFLNRSWFYYYFFV